MMKKIVCCAFALAFICLSFPACTRRSGGYRLVDMPDSLSIDAATLPDEIDRDSNEYFKKDFPLVASVESEGLYIYDVRGNAGTGVLVKYKKAIQYFAWTYRAGTSAPQAHVADYDGDGEKEIAVSLLVNEGMVNHNENLYILKETGGKLNAVIYSNEALAGDAKASSSYTLDKDDSGSFTLFVGSDKEHITVKAGRKLIGLYYEDVQRYSLGDTITAAVKVGFVYEDTGTPEYDGTQIRLDVSYLGTHCSALNGTIFTANDFTENDNF